jgi:histidinol-phosphate aminotransferase
MGFIVLPSKANFLFVRHGSIPAPEVYSFLREKGILVRHFNADRINQFLRISIGTEQDMEILCAALADLTAAGKA